MKSYFSKFLTVALVYFFASFALSFVAATPAHADESIHIDSAEWLNSTTIRFHYSNNTYAPGPITLVDVESDGSLHSGAKDYPTSATSGYVDFTGGNTDDLYYGADLGYTRYFAIMNGGGFANRSNIIRLAAYVVPPHNAPVSTISYSAEPDSEGQYPNPVSISFAATADNGYQVAQIWASVDGGDPSAYTVPFQLFGTGSHNIIYWSVDNSGIEETHHSTTITLQRQGINIDSAEWVNATTIRFHYSQNTYAPGPMTLTFVEPNGLYHAGAKDYPTSATSGYAYYTAPDNDALYFNADPGYTRYYALVGGNFADRSNIVRLPQYAGQIIDDAPTVGGLLGETINEGGTYSGAGSFTDPDSTAWTATVDYGDGSGSQPLILSGQNFNISHVYKDNGAYTVRVTVIDDGGQSTTQTASVSIVNIAPAVGTITASINPILINTATTASANFTDPGVLDTHTASWNWGDGMTTNGTVTENNGSGSISNSHSYTAPGVYTVTLTLTDKDNGQGTSVYQYISAYATTTKSVSGSKEYVSPVGGLLGNPTMTGTASFGFTAQYDNVGNVIPQGNKWASLTLKNGNTTYVDFNATAYTSLVVSGAKATLQGTGTYNGNIGYTVLITAIDGSQSGGQDLVRYQIKSTSTGAVVYDSQPGAPLTTDPSTPVSKGKITVK